MPPQHGFPLRVVNGWYGLTNVKWLGTVTLLPAPSDGYQNAVAYRLYGADGEPGEPVTRMLPRSLMVPPRRARLREPRAPARTRSGGAAGGAPGRGGGRSSGWRSASTAAGLRRRGSRPPLSPVAWRGWSFRWDAPAGRRELCSRATDVTGRSQPIGSPWNLKGYANNAVERIPVTVG